MITFNNKKRMLMLSMMPMDMEHIDEICEDAKRQQSEGIADFAMMAIYLAPEGTPCSDKAAIYAKQYNTYKKKLDDMGVRNGAFIQSTIGHGAQPEEDFPFEHFQALSDGNVKGSVCPLDENFRKFIKGQMQTIAKEHPPIIMIDDDNGLIYRGKGCCCPLHMKALEKKIGKSITREQLWEHTQGNSDEDKFITTQFIDTQRDALVGCAKAMREGIDSVDPSIQGIISTAANYCEFTDEIADAFCGSCNPKIVRINNGNYTPQGARYFSVNMLRAATQREILGDKINFFLAETDTCPQNRYSTGAQSLHSHLTGTILEGAKGAKHWITRMNAYEPSSGEAYRKILAKNRGFYEKLGELTDVLKPVGCRIPLSSVKDYGFTQRNVLKVVLSGFASCVLERFGIPMYFSKESGGAVFLDDNVVWKYTDEQIIEMLKGPIFLSAKAAMDLEKRGFSKHTGVLVREWNGKKPSEEVISGSDKRMPVQVGIHKLIPVSKTVKLLSEINHIKNISEKEYLSPAVTSYKNELGGTVFTFCGTPHTEFRYTQAFSFLNETRKTQFIRMLKSVGCIPVYYPGDIDVYMRAGYLPDNSLLCAMFNISLDPMEEVSLVLDKKPSGIKKLMPDGNYSECQFYEKDGVTYIKNEALNILDPKVFIIKL